MDPAANLKIVQEEWDAALPSLQDFIRIPNISVIQDQEWETNGLLDKACHHIIDWVKAQNVEGCTVEYLKDDGFSPFVIIEIPATKGSPKAANTFVMYGHLDKQPHGPGWDPDISPTSGLLRDGKVYGRGAADDGYAVYCCVIAVKALQRQGVDHPRMIIIAETSEESGSPHLGHYMEKLAPRIGNPSAVFCMDSLAEDYDTLWLTTSLRGVIMGSVEVSLLSAGLHSGFGGGIVPDAFRVARQLLARVEDPATGRVLVPELRTKIPVERQAQLKALSETVKRPDITRSYPWREGALPDNLEDPFAMYLANTWEPCMTVIGFDGLPQPGKGGNVLNSSVKLVLSFRIPPLVDPTAAREAAAAVLRKDPPCGATVSVDFHTGAPGWDAPESRPNLEAALTKACKANFNGKDVGHTGVGATIPLMNMLSQMFPDASLVCTGVLGPGTSMHGPNEHLPVDYTVKVTATIAMVMGILEPEEGVWPDDVPQLDSGAGNRRRSAPRFCFTQPDVPVGQCLCCL